MISVEALSWLYNHLEGLEPGEDEALRQEAVAALHHAVLHDSAFISIREAVPAKEWGPVAAGVLQEA